MTFKFLLLSTLATAAVALPAPATTPEKPAPIQKAASAPIPSYTENQSVFIPYSKSFQLKTKIIWDPSNPSAAKFRDVTMDTGSTAITYQWKYLSKELQDKHDEYEVGFKYLSSSQILYTGYWVPVTVEFGGAEEGIVVAEVPILATVHSGKCETWNEEQKASCVAKDGSVSMTVEGGKQPKKTKRTYMGVGFGRENDGMGQCTPDKNPMLNIVKIGTKAVTPGKNFRRGYIVTQKGIHVGLTKENTKGFKTAQKLEMRKTPANEYDWDGPKMCISVNAPGKYPTAECLRGGFLADTGISHMYMTIDDTMLTRDETVSFENKYGKTSRDLKKDYHVSIDLEGAGKIELTKGKGGIEPENFYTMWSSAKNNWKAPWANVGNRFYKQYDMMFDAKDGLFSVRDKVEN